jgi:predicted nucleic acid-binding protein
MDGVVIDANVFVAAGFNASSASARIVGAVREGRLRLLWNTPTRNETETILRRIPVSIGRRSRTSSSQRVSLLDPSTLTLSLGSQIGMIGISQR